MIQNREMSDKINLKLFYPNYFSFFVNGAMVLVIGSVLPYLIEEAHINYSIAGLFLSVFAIGNLIASFVNPFLSKIFGRKISIIITSIFQPTALIGISLVPPVPVIVVLFFFLGIARGSFSIINNAHLNEKSDGSASAMNILHASFAMGAFSAPILLSVLFRFDFNWRISLYIISLGSILAVFFLSKLDLNHSKKIEVKEKKDAKPFYKMPVFWITGFILFFYLGFENCINGWFVTYFKKMGIMSETFANELVSMTWISVLVGRLLTAFLSSKLKKRTLILADCLFAAIFFILLISTHNLLVITISIIGLGLFLAGIYPTGVSNARDAISGSDFGTSMFLVLPALGGIITPQVVGSVADKIGLVGAVCSLLVNAIMMIILSIANFKLKKD